MKRQTILKLIGEPNLSLFDAPGYFYFEYDDGVILETRNVMVDRLSHLFIDEWVEEGKDFVKDIKNESTQT